MAEENSKFEDKTKILKIWFQDEAKFGRINDIKGCWAPSGTRPLVKHRAIRQYSYVYSAVAPYTGENFNLIMPYANTVCMKMSLHELSRTYPNRNLLIFMDQAGWHKSNDLEISQNIRLSYIPPYSPELNPTENYWKFIRGTFFRNKYFDSFEQLEELLYSSLILLYHSYK
ncbi:transposase [Alphaproteobacteria bacterium]